MLDEQSNIKYRCESSHPMGGRPDVDAIIAGYNWSLQNAIDHPEYKARDTRANLDPIRPILSN